MSQTEQPIAPADAARQQMQQLKADSGQQLAQLMLAQQLKLSQMVRQLQNQQQPAAALRRKLRLAIQQTAPALAGVLHLQQRNMGNLDLLLQRINTTMHGVLATPGPLQERVMVTKTVQLFEAVKTADGDYECQPVSVAEFEAPLTTAGIAAEPSAAAPSAQQVFFIDSDIMQAVLPDWAAEAQAVFLQSLHSNALGGHSLYFQQVHARFEQMRQTLQQQLDQFSRYG